MSTSTAPTSTAPAPTAVAHGGPGPDLPDDRGLAEVLDTAAARTPDRVAFALTHGTTVTAAGLRDDVRRVAARLVADGLAAGERVAVLGLTSYPWIVVDLAVLAVGGVTVPVYPTSSPAQVAHILADSGAVTAWADTPDQGALLDAQAPGLRAPTRLLADALDDGLPVEWEPTELDRRWAGVRADDLATIVYTSGTTGPPKGCMITHRNMFTAAAGVVARQPAMFGGHDGAQAVTILALPLSHVFGRTVLFSCLIGGSATTPVTGFPEMLEVLPTVAPTFLTLVPYGLEKIRKSGTPLGGRLSEMICGGASLDPATAQWFVDIGVTVYQAYGLTETATAATVNPPGPQRAGSVGPPIAGVTVGIADDGEVLVAGPNVTPGYWGRAPRSDDGWLHTGDLGTLDADGFLTITGRRKEVLVTSGGKNVAPAPLEDRVRRHPGIGHCLVLGDARPYVTALVTLDPTEALAAEDALAVVAAAVADANDTVSRAESIRRFRILDGEFTIAAGHLTPSMKMRRAEIERAFADDVEALYR